MKILGFRFTARREPRYPSYTQFEEMSALVYSLSDGLTKLNLAIEATKKKVYRDEKKVEVEEILDDGKKPSPIPQLVAGQVLTPEQVRSFGG